MKKHLSAIFSALLITSTLMPMTSNAALPDSVSGQPLPSLAPMLDKTIPAVVNVSVTSNIQMQSNPLMQDPFFRRFFQLPPQHQQPKRRAQSAGSGVIVDAENGYIITNHHVIDNADEIEIRLHDGREFDAKLIGSDPGADVAVVQIDADDLSQISVANSDKLRVGDFAVAIGNPFGLSQTVTSGIVSGLNRTGLGIEGYENFIQTDASINPGNSGGALVNLNGELIGINTAIKTPSGGNVGIGFAIPSNMAKSIMNQLIEHGEVRRGRLGIYIQDVTPELRKVFHTDGVAVTNVEAGSPAEKAGLKPGDVITKLNGVHVKSAADLRNKVGLLAIGTKVNVDLVRDGDNKKFTVTIGDPSDLTFSKNDSVESLRGASLRDLSKSELDTHGNGILVVNIEPGSEAEKADLQKGDVIMSVNHKRVKSVGHFKKLAAQSKELLLLIHRNGGNLFILVK